MASGEIMILFWHCFDFFLQSEELDFRDFFLVKLFWLILYPQFKVVTQGIVPLIWDLIWKSGQETFYAKGKFK